MGEYRALRLDRLGDVLRVTIDNPASDWNTVDETLHAELARLFEELRSDTDARAIVLTGSKRAFSAGGDFGWFPTLTSVDALEHLRQHARRMVNDLLDVPMPIVAAVNGPAVGLGASIALLCDVIVMAESAHLADPHVLVGLVAGDGGAVIWPLALGPARAKQYLLTGDPVPAREAERLGLVNVVVPDDDLPAEALRWAERLAAGAPLAIRYTKLAVNKIVKDAFNTAFDAATALELVTFLSADHQEALAARREKREPRFEGR